MLLSLPLTGLQWARSPQPLWDSCLRGSGKPVILFQLTLYSQVSLLGEHTLGPQAPRPLISAQELRGQHPPPTVLFPVYPPVPGLMATHS